MVPDTEFTAALTKPLDVVQDIYDKSQDKSAAAFARQVESHFRQTFPDTDARNKIPTLSPELIRSPSSKLVRWRCMIQDTGLGTEVFLASSRNGDQVRSGLFGAETANSDAAAEPQLDQVDNANLAERSVVYAVSVPGRSAWLKRAWGEGSHQTSTSDDHVQALSSGVAYTSLADIEPESPKRVEEVRQRVKAAADAGKAIGGSGKVPRLVAISKLHPPSAILAANRKAGQVHFGENYVQEMVDKAKVLPREIKWHFVGGLQSNKGKLLASIPNLYLLETLDSIKAANVLQKALASPDACKRDEPLQVYLQVNTSGEDAKSGQPPILDNAEGQDRPLLDLATHVITKCPHLRLRGVMTIGAAANSANSAAGAKGEKAKSVDEIVSANPDFETLIKTRSNLVQLLRSSSEISGSKAEHIQEAYGNLLDKQGPADGGLELSMGMSADLEVATMAGSDNVRVGTDCFGKRPPSRDEAMAGMKRELEVGIEAAMAELRSSTTSSPSQAPVQTAGTAAAYQDPIPQKAPLPEEEHMAALVKLYDVDAAEKLKTTELVEVVGILDSSPLPHSEWQETGASNPDAGSLAPEVPCIHALFIDPLDLNAVEAGSVTSFDRPALIDYLASNLGGDKVAAELVLLSAVARIQSRRGGIALGALSVNLSNFPAPTGSQRPKISAALSQLLPAVADVSLNLDILNDPKKALSPRSSGGEHGLEAGRLQLANGTMMVVNEGSMQEGQLKENGMRNIKALASVLELHKLGYVFPYSEFEFETDMNALILSQGKSFLPFDVQCPLESDTSDLYGESASNQVDEETLAQWRRAVLAARSAETAKAFEIPPEVSEQIQHEFVAARKEEHGGAKQEDLVRRMALVRLLAISRGEGKLTSETWKRAVQLDQTVAERLSRRSA